MKWLKRLGRLQTVSFLTGFCLLTYELAAARVLAPVIGSSTYVWTSVIGVIIAALALGFFAGGKLADARDRPGDLARLLLLAAGLAAVSLVIYPGVLDSIATTQLDTRLLAFYVALILFAPTSFAIGMTSPYVAKLSVRSLTTTGQRIAAIDAFNSIGGIVGTFLTGFVLFGIIGSRETFLVVIVLLLGASWFVVPKQRWAWRLALSLGIFGLGLAGMTEPQARITIDTPSANYQIQEFPYQHGRMVRGLTSGPSGVQSGIYLDDPDELTFWYVREFAKVIEAAPHRQSILMLGGGTYTFPRYLAQTYPDAEIDVVEIDPELTTIAREHFFYNDPPNVSLVYDDARAYLNKTDKAYDIILMDVYSDTSVPFSLMTREYGEQVARLLNSEGIVVVNAIAAPSGQCASLYDAIVRAYQPVGHHYLQQAQRSVSTRGNIILVFASHPPTLEGYQTLSVSSGTPVYTDNFMPAEVLSQRCLGR